MTPQSQVDLARHRENLLPHRANRADIPVALTTLLADMYALYLKTKNFHWHVSGPHFRDYHLLLDEQAGQILGTTDTIAERVRKLGGQTIKSIGHIGRLQRIKIMMPRRLRHAICWRSCWMITGGLPGKCWRHIRFATRAVTLRALASSRSGSTKPKAAPGFCSKP